MTRTLKNILSLQLLIKKNNNHIFPVELHYLIKKIKFFNSNVAKLGVIYYNILKLLTLYDLYYNNSRFLMYKLDCKAHSLVIYKDHEFNMNFSKNRKIHIKFMLFFIVLGYKTAYKK